MSELTNLLTDKITENIDSSNTLIERVPDIQKNVDLFGGVCTTVDAQILPIINNIVTLQNEIVVLSTNAYAVGCGTTAGQSTVYPDTATIQSFNISSKNYSGDDPYDVNSESLSSSNVGFGTFTIHTQNDSSSGSLGILYGDIGTCYRTFPLTCGDCASFAASIAAKQTQIATLRNQIPTLVSDTNKVKRERLEYEMERYGHNYAIDQIEKENRRIGIAITAILTYET